MMKEGDSRSVVTLVPDSEKTSHVYYKRYSWHWKGVGICWGLLTICFLIMNIIVFTEPQWIGDSESSLSIGWMGLYEYCELFNSQANVICRGQFQDFSTIPAAAWAASTFFIGVSILLIFCCIFCFLFFFFKSVYKYAYIICGCFQAVSTLFMFLGNVIYPHGWDNPYVKRICGPKSGRYHLGDCTFRWAYMLSIVAMCCIFMITVLAFVLASRTAARMRNYEAKSIAASRPGSLAGASFYNPNMKSVHNGSQY